MQECSLRTMPAALERARGLARKLSDEGFSLKYFSICGAIWQFVTSMDRKLHVSKIAWLLGFQEVSAFTHAFQALDLKDAAPNAKPLLSTPPQRWHSCPKGRVPLRVRASPAGAAGFLLLTQWHERPEG